MEREFLDINKQIIDAIFALDDVELNDDELNKAVDDVVDDFYANFSPTVPTTTKTKEKKTSSKKSKSKTDGKIKTLKLKKL